MTFGTFLRTTSSFRFLFGFCCLPHASITFKETSNKINPKYNESSYTFTKGEEIPGLWKQLGQDPLGIHFKNAHLHGPHPSFWEFTNQRCV